MSRKNKDKKPDAPASKPLAEIETLNSPPDQRLVIAVALFALLQLAIPLRYYLGDDLYDERFAWRMFSAVRVQQCEVDVRETSGGQERPVQLYSILPAPWVSLVQRNRPQVIERFMRWRCDQADIESMSVRHQCLDASGDPLEPIVRSFDCGANP